MGLELSDPPSFTAPVLVRYSSLLTSWKKQNRSPAAAPKAARVEEFNSAHPHPEAINLLKVSPIPFPHSNPRRAALIVSDRKPVRREATRHATVASPERAAGRSVRELTRLFSTSHYHHRRGAFYF